ncbi:hypothetical protein ANN_12250 [Periplaneta americana]|uniref:Uncharacterized protein n=1 Tax=Periplaneta americana TaxID=6978 RepID=A0ABQ8TG66_PERAM|nr:hypothetical protein ANN_12250 [Periplaneta americana]
MMSAIQSYEIFPRRPNAISRMMSETRSARELRDETRKTNATNTASESDIILPVVLYGCETWTLTLREEQRLRVSENKALSKLFGAKRDEVTGEWRKLHNAELHALYSSPDIIRNIKSRRLRWAGHVARMGESRNAYRVLVGRPEEKDLWGGRDVDAVKKKVAALVNSEYFQSPLRVAAMLHDACACTSSSGTMKVFHIYAS